MIQKWKPFNLVWPCSCTLHLSIHFHFLYMSVHASLMDYGALSSKQMWNVLKWMGLEHVMVNLRDVVKKSNQTLRIHYFILCFCLCACVPF